jgi:hypothetical protein
MVGTRKLARLLGHAEAARAKVLLVGDPCQLPEIDAGGAEACGPASAPATSPTTAVRPTPWNATPWPSSGAATPIKRWTRTSSTTASTTLPAIARHASCSSTSG